MHSDWLSWVWKSVIWDAAQDLNSKVGSFLVISSFIDIDNIHIHTDPKSLNRSQASASWPGTDLEVPGLKPLTLWLDDQLRLLTFCFRNVSPRVSHAAKRLRYADRNPRSLRGRVRNGKGRKLHFAPALGRRCGANRRQRPLKSNLGMGSVWAAWKTDCTNEAHGPWQGRRVLLCEAHACECVSLSMKYWLPMPVSFFGRGVILCLLTSV